MRASAIEFRLRVPMIVALIGIGYWAPWIESRGMLARTFLLVEAAASLARVGVCSFAIATKILVTVAILLAANGAWLRVWGAAYLSPAVVYHREMKAVILTAQGPYRLIRNPLYLGSWCMVAAMSLLMPPSGALITMAALTILFVRLIGAEEAFLVKTLGEPYLTYQRRVPSLLPRWGSRTAESVMQELQRPHWLCAGLAELNSIGVFLIFASLAWRYDHVLLIKAIVVNFGFSLIVRALLPNAASEPSRTEVSE